MVSGQTVVTESAGLSARRRRGCTRPELADDADRGAIGEVELEVVSAEGDLIEPASSQGTEFGPDRQPSYGQANPIPDPPEVFSDGLPAAIWT